MVDPLGGAWFVEELTDRMEAEAKRYIDRIDEMGGIVRAVELGFPQHEIADSAFRFQQQVERGEQSIVGVNKYADNERNPIPTLKITDDVERAQKALLAKVKAERNAEVAAAHIEAIRQACAGDENIVYPIVDAVKADVTLGEICEVFREVFGVYRDPAFV